MTAAEAPVTRLRGVGPKVEEKLRHIEIVVRSSLVGWKLQNRLMM